MAAVQSKWCSRTTGITKRGRTLSPYYSVANHSLMGESPILFWSCAARLKSLRNNSLDEGHGFAGCGKTHVLYQGTTLVVP
jgi:hypothetical protein